MKECSEEEADSKLKKIIKKEINKLSRDFAPYKRVKHFNLRYEEFPKTTTKKIKRYLFNSLAIDD